MCGSMKRCFITGFITGTALALAVSYVLRPAPVVSPTESSAVSAQTTVSSSKAAFLPPAKGSQVDDGAVQTAPDYDTSLLTRHHFEKLGWELAAQSFDAVLAEWKKLKDVNSRLALLRGAFEQIGASRTPQQALELVARLSSASDREQAFRTLLPNWNQSVGIDWDAAGESPSAAMMVGMYLLHGKDSPGPLAIAQMARQFLRGKERASLLGEAAAKLARTDPARAYDLGAELAGDHQMIFMRKLAEGWAGKDADAAWNWASSVPDESIRAELQARVAVTVGRGNPQKSLERLAALPETDPRRAAAIHEIVQEWARRDTSAAMAWAEQLPTQPEREAAQKGIRTAMPVGIGAMIHMDDQQAVVGELMPGGAASRSGILKAGDRILAVSDSSGNWIRAQDLPLQELVNHIRGEPQTAVSMRIQPADGSPVRVVTITREQTLARPM